MGKLRSNKYLFLAAYKLLNDMLFLVLTLFFVTLIADGLIPGIITDHISYSRQIILLGLNLAAIYLLGYLIDVRLDLKRDNKKTTIFLAVISSFLILNGLLKINFYLAILILAFALILFFLLYKNIFEKA